MITKYIMRKGNQLCYKSALHNMKLIEYITLKNVNAMHMCSSIKNCDSNCNIVIGQIYRSIAEQIFD